MHNSMIKLSVSSSERVQMLDITDAVRSAVSDSGVKEGVCVVFSPHTTGAIMLNERTDPNVGHDVNTALTALFPEGRWSHDRVDGNGDSHIKSALIGAEKTIIIEDCRPVLGTWQGIFFTEFDGPRDRKVFIRIIEDDRT